MSDSLAPAEGWTLLIWNILLSRRAAIAEMVWGGAKVAVMSCFYANAERAQPARMKLRAETWKGGTSLRNASAHTYFIQRPCGEDTDWWYVSNPASGAGKNADVF